MQNTGKKKERAGKTLNRAGATRLFGLSAAQKVLGSLPPAPSSSGRCFARVHTEL